MLKVAINGFGRIGRTSFKIALDKFSDEIEIVGINDLTDGTIGTKINLTELRTTLDPQYTWGV